MSEGALALLADLTNLVSAETAALEAQHNPPGLAAMVEAKRRLAERLEQVLAEARRAAGWPDGLEPEARAALAEAAAGLAAAVDANARLLDRRIRQAGDMLEAVAVEMRRLSGRHALTYGRSGALGDRRMAVPLSVNSRF